MCHLTGVRSCCWCPILSRRKLQSTLTSETAGMRANSACNSRAAALAGFLRSTQCLCCAICDCSGQTRSRMCSLLLSITAVNTFIAQSAMSDVAPVTNKAIAAPTRSQALVNCARTGSVFVILHCGFVSSHLANLDLCRVVSWLRKQMDGCVNLLTKAPSQSLPSMWSHQRTFELSVHVRLSILRSSLSSSMAARQTLRRSECTAFKPERLGLKGAVAQRWSCSMLICVCAVQGRASSCSSRD